MNSESRFQTHNVSHIGICALFDLISGLRLNSPLPGPVWDIDWALSYPNTHRSIHGTDSRERQGKRDSPFFAATLTQRLQYLTFRLFLDSSHLLKIQGNTQFDISRCALIDHPNQSTTLILRIIDGE